MIGTLSSIYGAAAAWRREWYSRHPERRRRLARPVISVGNLNVGGSGKTPVVAYVARLLLARGERPAILSRGYARPSALDGATVVSDGKGVRMDFESAGDEPLMLASSVSGAIVVVGADRYLSGCLAERRFGATVHILDDGFQHCQLARDVELLVVSQDDVADRPLPAGRLRERIAAASRAHAVIVPAADAPGARRVGDALGIGTAFQMLRTLGWPRPVTGMAPASVPAGARVVAVAGVARPERFFADLAAAGWEVVSTMSFPDHHLFDARDLARMAAACRQTGACAVLTTDKDAVRLAACRVEALRDLPVAAIALTVTVEPAEPFRAWIFERLSRAT